jgi:predicted ribosomally synthesized peptide with nif11-like leader
MSKENLDQFIQQISDSEELQTRIGDEIDTDALIALGAEHGCEFTAEDLTEYAELSDEELDGVAGGGRPERIARRANRKLRRLKKKVARITDPHGGSFHIEYDSEDDEDFNPDQPTLAP